MDEPRNHYEVVIKSCKKLETTLVDNWGAEGRGLGEKVTSVSTELPREVVILIYKISSIRNKLVHEDSFELSSIDDFISYVNKAKSSLELLHTERKQHSVTPTECDEVISKVNYKRKRNTNNINFRKILFYAWLAIGLFLLLTNPTEQSLAIFLFLFIVYLILSAARKVILILWRDIHSVYYWLLSFFL